MHLILAALSLGAAAIHLAAGPAHVEAMGDLGLGFYWIALLQVGIAIGCLRAGATGPGPWLRRIALAGSVAIIGAWLLSRTVGLPLVPGGVEPIGTADLVATILQVCTIVGLVAWTPGRDRWTALRRLPRPARTLVSGAMIGVLSVIALSSTIAVADAAAGHGHAPSVAAEHLDDGHGPAENTAPGAEVEVDTGRDPAAEPVDLPSDHGHGTPLVP